MHGALIRMQCVSLYANQCIQLYMAHQNVEALCIDCTDEPATQSNSYMVSGMTRDSILLPHFANDIDIHPVPVPNSRTDILSFFQEAD